MASPDDFSIVPPPPSYPTETYKNYKVFPDFVEETMDKILSEEANLEESRSSDWPFYSGADGSGDSPASYSLRNGDVDKTNALLSTPRVMTKTKAKKILKSTKSKKKRSAAKREITVIDLCSDDEVPVRNDIDIDRDKHDEYDDSQEVNGDVNLQTVDTLENDSDDTSEFVDAMEGGVETVNVNIVNAKTVNVNIVNAKTVESDPVHVKTVEANVAAGDRIGVSENGVRHPGEDFEEEKIIFSSVTESVKGHVLHFIVAHPFMSQFVQPVKRSARRQFIMDMCKEALSKGLDPAVIWDLIKYVRRLYLDSAGVRAEPLAAGLEDIPFGEEVDDEPESKPSSRKSHKRSRNEGSPGLKNKRSKRRLLDVQEPSQPAAVPEVIEIADDDTNPPSPELPNSPSYTKDEHTIVVQVQSTPDSPLNPIVTDYDEVPNEIVESLHVESTPELPSHLFDVQAQGNYEGATIVQVESTPELPLESGDATVSHTAETAETIATENFIVSGLPIEEMISAHDEGEGPGDAQGISNPAKVGERADDEVVPESLQEPEISPQAAADIMTDDLNPTIVPEENKNPPANLSKSHKRNARRQLLKKAQEEGKTTETEDDIKPVPPLQKPIVSGNDHEAPAAHKTSTAGASANGEGLPGNLDVSNAPPKATTNLIQENLFPDLPSEPISKATTKQSKNQKRQERRKARREKRERKNQERREKELNAQQQPANSWLKHHHNLDSHDAPAQTLQRKKLQARVPLSKPLALDPEPRKEKKRKEREHKREQKRERKRRRESLKLEHNSNIINDDRNQDDLLTNEDPELDEQGLKRQRKKEQKEERKRQKQFLALHHNKDDVEYDGPTPGVRFLDGSIESHKPTNDRGEDEISSDHDEPKTQVHVPRETPQAESTVAEKSCSPSPPQPETPVAKIRESKSTPQHGGLGAVPMPMSTPTSQCASASRSSDLPGVTPSDEVKSKYFCTASKTDIPTLKTNTNTISNIASPLLEMSLPEKTPKILEQLNLNPDFLSSDSSLSDPPSDLDFELEDDLALYPTPKVSPSKSPHFLPPESASRLSTPIKRTIFLEPEISKVPQPKQPKTSPYFPKTPDLPQSCLPFPSIDAPSFGLVQEQLAHEPFKLLVATIFLNRTRGGVALPILFKVFEQYPTIDAMASADLAEFVSMIRCLGFQNQRAKKCIGIAQLWQTDPPVKNKRYRKVHYPRKLDGRDVPADECIDDEDPRAAWEIAHLPGVGAYSLDSWRIFCRDELRGLAKDWKGTGSDVHGFVPEWKSVLPQDKELRAYLTWMWLKEGWVWDCHSGDLTPAGDKTLRAARREGVAHEEDGNWVLQTSPVKKALNGLHAMD